MAAVTELEAKQLLAEYDIPVITEEAVDNVEDAVDAADRIGYPVFLKVDGAAIQHKTDIGAVMEADSPEQVRDAYHTILDNTKEQYDEDVIEGVLVEEKATGVELIVGVNNDPTFGHVIMFGLGGIFVEVLQDVHFRALPITRQDAEELIEEMRSKKILDGVRGMPQANRDALIQVMLQVNEVVADHPNIETLDINPLFVNAEEAVAVDALLEVNDA